LGYSKKELPVINTSKRPQAKLISEPNTTIPDVNNEPKDTPSKEVERNSTIESSTESSVEASTNERTNCMFDLSVDIVTIYTCFVVISLSPIDIDYPNTFFTPSQPEGETLRENSSIGQKEIQIALPDSPTFVRPPLLKSWNASWIR
jgi:protein N-terminal amidase